MARERAAKAMMICGGAPRTMRARSPRKAFGCAALALLSACITPASGKTMAITTAELEGPASPAIAGTVAVGQVTGGKGSVGSIGDAPFREALVESLRTAGILCEAPSAPLSVDARILEVGHGEGASTFNSSVRSEIRYTVRETRSGGLVIDDVISVTHVATTSDALVGATRHVIAVEGSARRNLAALVKRLNSIERKGAPPAGKVPAAAQ